MGTTARISIRIKPELKGLARFHIKEWRTSPERGHYDTECNLLINDNVMSIYINYDGYLKGVGNELYKCIRTYKEAFDFIIQGNRSTFDQPYYECDESWESNKPSMSADFPDNATFGNYYYKWDEFEGEEQWMVRKDSESEYTPLKRFFKAMDIQIVRD
ncbi:MAG: hypothetical protein J6M23_03585 [Bacteroidales bacterium]|nr:hypothetical protein [Bacteroidales bacterium]